MKTQFDILKKSREVVLKTINGLTLAQLHKIPNQFNNNIAWNIVHLIATQQLLHYRLSGLSCLVSDNLIEAHRKGTFPTKNFNQQEFDEIVALFTSLPKILEENYNAGIFKNYKIYPTSTGFVLDSIETAISFNNYHEGLHLGSILALKKLV